MSGPDVYVCDGCGDMVPCDEEEWGAHDCPTPRVRALIIPSSDSRRSILVRHAGAQPAGAILTYEALAALLGLEDDPDHIRKIQGAKADAWLELGEAYGRALVGIPNIGYEVVTGQQFFRELVLEVGRFLRRCRRIANRFEHVDGEELTARQLEARTSIAARLHLSWKDIRSDYRKATFTSLPEDPGEE